MEKEYDDNPQRELKMALDYLVHLVKSDTDGVQKSLYDSFSAVCYLAVEAKRAKFKKGWPENIKNSKGEVLFTPEECNSVEFISKNFFEPIFDEDEEQKGGAFSMPKMPKMSKMPAGLPQVPAGLPQVPAGLPQVPAGLPQAPAGLPQVPAGLPQAPGGLPQVPAGLPQPPGLPQAPGLSLAQQVPGLSQISGIIGPPPVLGGPLAKITPEVVSSGILDTNPTPPPPPP